MTRLARSIVASTPLALVLAIAPRFASADATGAPSVCASCVVAPAPTPRPVELAHRWSVAARGVSLTLGDPADDTSKTTYGGGGLSVGYRLNARWEFLASFDALDAPEGPDLHAAALTARFHFRPLQRWDWYALAGLGAVHEVPLEEGDQMPADPPARAQLHAGVGLARRFPRWSLAAELHAVGIGPEKSPDATTVMREAPGSVMASGDKLSGGELTVAAAFYF